MKMLKIMMMMALTLAACGDDEEPATTLDCGQGDVLSVDDQTYCVYAQEVVVENGFDCPPMVPNLTQRGPIGVCSDRPMLPNEELDRIDDRYSERRPDLYEDECSIDSDCAAGQVCTSGECVVDDTNNGSTCTESTDCGSAETCDQGVCVAVCGGFAGFTCAADQYCDYPEGSICGAADQLGICRARPEACTQVLDPVCGCDGVDYSNGCIANSAGTDVAGMGMCN